MQSLVFTDVSALQRIALAVTETQLAKMPALRARYGPAGVQHCIDDTIFHLRYLGEAVEFDDPVLLADYIAWAKVMLAARGVGANDRTANLELIRGALLSEADRDSVAPALAILEHVLHELPAMPEILETFVGANGDLPKRREWASV